jgi:hypothetical protein
MFSPPQCPAWASLRDVAAVPSFLLEPNAARQPRPKAGAERTLEGVGWTRWLGVEDGRDTVCTRLLHGHLLLEAVPTTTYESQPGAARSPQPGFIPLALITTVAAGVVR